MEPTVRVYLLGAMVVKKITHRIKKPTVMIMAACAPVVCIHAEMRSGIGLLRSIFCTFLICSTSFRRSSSFRSADHRADLIFLLLKQDAQVSFSLSEHFWLPDMQHRLPQFSVPVRDGRHPCPSAGPYRFRGYPGEYQELPVNLICAHRADLSA